MKLVLVIFVTIASLGTAVNAQACGGTWTVPFWYDGGLRLALRKDSCSSSMIGVASCSDAYAMDSFQLKSLSSNRVFSATHMSTATSTEWFYPKFTTPYTDAEGRGSWCIIDEVEVEAEPCFAAHAQVMEKNYGIINMEDVAVGDWLMTEQGFYTEVVGWLHREEDRRSKFLEIVFNNEATNKTLTITENHHVRLANDVIVEALDVDVGSWLMGVDGSPKQVIDVREGYWRGVWAPLTRSGTVAVDGIQCSIYANGPAFEPVMHAFTYPWRNGWVVVPRDTDLVSVHGSFIKFYLNVVSWLKASEFV